MIYFTLIFINLITGCSAAMNDTQLNQFEPVQEQSTPDEKYHTQQLIDLLKEKMEKDYANTLMKRGAHPKHHGCVKAEFIVEPDLPDKCRIGVFKNEQTFDAWIRFSNGAGAVQSDMKNDIRGAAIKLLNVDGKKILEDELHEKTQDFLFLSNPIFPIRNVADFHKLVDCTINHSFLWFFFNPFDSHLRELKLFWQAAKTHVNPLDIRYWSTTPYLFGTKAVKYSIIPTSDNMTQISLDSEDNILREIMQHQLKEQEATFDFMVQFQTDARQMPIEDASVEWDESVSPFQKVATIKIPPQQFDSDSQMEFCENLSFTPWHSLPEHRPLGNINRARKEIYRELSKFRHLKNNLPRKKPVNK